MNIQKVSIPVGAQEYVAGTLFTPADCRQKRPAVLFIHGWASSEQGYLSRAEALARRGWAALTINLRGHGADAARQAHFSRHDHLQDVLAAYDFLAAHPCVDAKQIGVAGSSYGGYLAALLSSFRPVPSLVLRAPALYRDANFTTPTAWLIEVDESVYRQAGLPLQESMALQAIAQYQGNFLLIESALDDVCPQATTHGYLAVVNLQANVTHVLLPRAGHVLDTPETRQAFLDALLAWFAKTLPVANTP